MKVISGKNLPIDWPINRTILAILCLDYYQGSDTVKAVVYTLLVLMWVAIIFIKVNTTNIELFNKD